jgi:hypothetical protein
MDYRRIILLFLFLLSDNTAEKGEILNTLLVMSSILDLLPLAFLRRMLFLKIFRLFSNTHWTIHISNPFYEFLIRNSLSLYLLPLIRNHHCILMNRSNIFIVSSYPISFWLLDLFRANWIFFLNHLLKNKITVFTLKHSLIDLLLLLLLFLTLKFDLCALSKIIVPLEL